MPIEAGWCRYCGKYIRVEKATRQGLRMTFVGVMKSHQRGKACKEARAKLEQPSIQPPEPEQPTHLEEGESP